MNVYNDYLKQGAKVPHSNFPLSQKNYTTMPFGKLIPFYATETTFGDSVEITPSAFFRTFPMKFPLLNKLRLHVSYYYCRDRQVYENFEDFITQTGVWSPQHTTDTYPLLAYTDAQRKKMFSTNGIANSMGVAVDIPQAVSASDVEYGVSKSDNSFTASCDVSQNKLLFCSFTNPISKVNILDNLCKFTLGDLITMLPTSSISPDNRRFARYVNVVGNASVDNYLKQNLGNLDKSVFNAFTMYLPNDVTLYRDDKLTNYDDNLCEYDFFNKFTINPAASLRYVVTTCNVCPKDPPSLLQGHCSPKYAIFYDSHNLPIASGIFNDPNDLHLSEIYFNNNIEGRAIHSIVLLSNALSTPHTSGTYQLYGTYCNTLFDKTEQSFADYYPYIIMSVPYRNLDASQVANDIYKPENLGITAIPFRHYQRICNTFYRNEKNNPFMVDGYPEYNKYNTTVSGGYDSNVYDLESVPWQMDMFTTALPSPTGDIARPLVPIVDASGNISTQPQNRTLNIKFTNNKGDVVTAKSSLKADSGELTDLEITNSKDTDLSRAVGEEYKKIKTSLYEAASSGIDISTFNDISALERYIEFRFRNGLHYQDFVKGQFDVEVKFAEYKLPQFLGGFTKDIDTVAIENTALAGDNALGEMGAFGVVSNEGKSFRHFCDERGWIIGIAYIDVAPVYADVTLPQFYRKSQLDFYLPQFANLSMQPIPNKVISPQTSFAEGGKVKCEDTFGYQRPWYDYVGSIDRVSRGLLDEYPDFVMCRRFGSTPELGEEFLRVDQDQVNNSFIEKYQHNDKFIGVFDTRVVAKRPFPLFGLPAIQ